MALTTAQPSEPEPAQAPPVTLPALLPASPSSTAPPIRGEEDRLRALHELRAALLTTREPREIFDHLRIVASRVMPHDEARLMLFTGPNDVQLFASSGPPASPGSAPAPITQGGPAPAEDAFSPTDAGLISELLPTGEVGSGVRATLRIGSTIAGVLTILTRRPHPYRECDVLFVQLLADVVASALSRQQLTAIVEDAALERERAANLDASEQLLRALGNVLDIRQVFPQVSEIANKVLPHDRLTMTFYDGQGTCVLQAVSNDEGTLNLRATGVDMSMVQDGNFRIVDDLVGYTKPGVVFDPPDHFERMVAAGYRSFMSVCLSAREQRFFLQFWSKQVRAFRPAQVPIAQRIAQHVALAVSHEQLAEAARQAADAQARAERLEARVLSLSEELDSRSGYGRVVGHSDAWMAALRAATQVALTDTTVLVTGESGTGKEVIARFIHRGSPRSRGPFVAVNCAALPEQLLESELFGYERGAFTGAQQAKPGQIELASGGVLFLDEVSEMSLSSQAKFLRVLQEREFQRLGGTRTIKANVRVIAATNRDLRRAMERGDFREDLFYRLQVFDIKLPPLRERPEDILPLSEAFLEEIGRSFGRPPAGMTREAKQALLAYRWRGNVRELRNVLERAAIVCEGGLIAPEHLSLDLDERPTSSTSTNIKSVERHLVEQVLRETRGNKSQAARRLGLTRKQLYVRLRQYEAGE